MNIVNNATNLCQGADSVQKYSHNRSRLACYKPTYNGTESFRQAKEAKESIDDIDERGKEENKSNC